MDTLEIFVEFSELEAEEKRDILRLIGRFKSDFLACGKAESDLESCSSVHLANQQSR